MRHRLIKGIPAGLVAESIDLQSHVMRPLLRWR